MNKPVSVDADLAAPVVSTELPELVAPAAPAHIGPTYLVLGGISFLHFLNDTRQSLIPSGYPILKANYALDFGQIGLITLTSQFTASLLQPLIGHFTDKKAQPFSLAIGMGSTFLGLLLLSAAHSYAVILIAAAMIGLGSAVFHPESARIARLASGGRYGMAQSIFQVGGNAGTALGPVLAALVVVPFGQPSIGWFSILAFVAIVLLARIGIWYRGRIAGTPKAAPKPHPHAPGRRRVLAALVVLVALLFSKHMYMASLSSYYTFYLIEKFHVSTQTAQLFLFIFLGSIAAGVFFRGPLGDRFGRRYVIWFSILGALPFTLALPYAGLVTSAVLTMFIGFILASATSAIIVFAQELVPHRLGMISGLFFGFAFGIAGVGAAALGELADHYGIDFVYQVCSFLPALGLLAVLLPKMPRHAH
ncbi:MFS transporter [Rhodopseudomonas sp. B29]|uniref:MFS transporter n=1 Tax=Rhodopseudomonas sp. B29 TaxID=95607 RepID=UPI00034D98D0|nr:MFS transporter [Rhodopseudomonas sp. B29]